MPVIHCLANDGSPLGVHYSDIHGENGRAGVGGAELYILTLLKYWTDLGWDVTFLSLIHNSEPTRPLSISYAVFCLKKTNKKHTYT